MSDRIIRIIEENLILLVVFVLTLFILIMIAVDPLLTENEGFMYLATGIIITGLVNGIIQKNNASQQRSNEKVTETLATAASASQSQPAKEVVVETQNTTVNSNEQPQSTGDRPAAESPRPSWVDSPAG